MSHLNVDDLEYVSILPDIPAEVVDEVSEVRDYVPAMIGACLRQKTSTFLTGPQVGLDKRVIVTTIEGDYPRVFINPVVVHHGDEIGVHAINLKGEQFVLRSDRGYYEVVPDAGRLLAMLLPEALDVLDGV